VSLASLSLEGLGDAAVEDVAVLPLPIDFLLIVEGPEVFLLSAFLGATGAGASGG